MVGNISFKNDFCSFWSVAVNIMDKLPFLGPLGLIFIIYRCHWCHDLQSAVSKRAVPSVST